MSQYEKFSRQSPLVVLFPEMQAILDGAAPSTVRRLIADGKLPPPLVIGHARLWPRAELEAWITDAWRALGVAKRDNAAPTPALVREPATNTAGERGKALRRVSRSAAATQAPDTPGTEV
ncbi:MAG: hypothetical protein U1F63_02105 [Chitinivorax sp.]